MYRDGESNDDHLLDNTCTDNIVRSPWRWRMSVYRLLRWKEY